jgi:hypothetical protein
MGVSMVVKIEEVCELLKRLTEVSHQILDDVESVSKTGDHALFYDRMIANAQDLQSALTTSPQQVAQTTRQGEEA